MQFRKHSAAYVTTLTAIWRSKELVSLIKTFISSSPHPTLSHVPPISLLSLIYSTLVYLPNSVQSIHPFWMPLSYFDYLLSLLALSLNFTPPLPFFISALCLLYLPSISAVAHLLLCLWLTCWHVIFNECTVWVPMYKNTDDDTKIISQPASVAKH